MANNDPVLIPYVIQAGSCWYVAYKEKNPFVPEITVSAKGIANHMSEEINDGCDFGPDSYNPSVTSGVPLTQTSGIQEAWNYAFSKTLSIGFGGQPVIHFSEGTFYLNEDVTIAGTSTVKPNVVITGSGKKNTWIFINNTNGNGIVFDPATLGDIYISNLSIHAPVAVNTMLNYYSSTLLICLLQMLYYVQHHTL